MKFYEIALDGGSHNAHQTFYVQLGDYLVDFKLNYLTLIDTWTLDLSIAGEDIATGISLLPDVDLLATYKKAQKIGSLYLTGKPATLDNIGIDNKLVWIEPTL